MNVLFVPYRVGAPGCSVCYLPFTPTTHVSWGEGVTSRDSMIISHVNQVAYVDFVTSNTSSIISHYQKLL